MSLVADPLEHAARRGVRVMIVEDHRMVADNLAFALRANGHEPLVASAFDCDSVLAARAWHDAEVVVLDLQLGPDASGGPLVRPLSRVGARVIVLSGVTDPEALAACAESGAAAVIGKGEPFDRLIDVVTEVIEGGDGFRRGERDELIARARRARAERDARLEPFRSLTARERTVLRLLVRGLQAEAIAERSYVSMATVRTQIRSVLVKLGVNSQLAAVAMANAAGWDGDEPSGDSSI